MSSSPVTEDTEDPPETAAEPAPKRGKRKLVMIAVPAALLLAGGGLWFSGLLPFGHARPADQVEAEKIEAPVYVDVPELVANLNTGSRKASYVKMTVRIEVLGNSDADKVRAAMPRVLDVVQTYLREMRPEELRGSAGVYRLREELLVRTNAAVAPAKVNDILFTQMLIQ
ncbi:MAG TPA: flagellar basal body-associated FliL family protein [Rhodopila sp.]|uniref:flagellar basal body-associated FliL family protein n=1 Tax=Rhodopila sp. TaxID=2480087 RepID=UPI002CA2D326|nr:flagellar basal body-associated FliL family protein [Rhodopila sp.]HVY17757.1 flagellar basal body-associated FliL family protein [Rhodopila sp.]